MKNILTAKNITKFYGNRCILKDINLTVSTSKVVAIMGESGAGKSTLLHVLSTMDAQDSGMLEINGMNVALFNEDNLSSFRNCNIGFVFQFHNLLPEFTVLENVSLPAYIKGTPKKEADTMAKELLGMLNMKDYLNYRPCNLSGGEQQRTAIARALINKPKLVFADEPSGSLDSHNASIIHNLFLELRDKLGQTFIIATHNQNFANISDRKLVIKDGILVS